MRLVAFFLLFSFVAQAKIIDKVAGVINDKVFTLSEINRIQDTIGVRKEIAPFIYVDSKYSKKDILRLMQNTFIIRNKLEELGFIISDDQVEDRIEETQTQLRLTRDQLHQFLSSKGISYNEYFEILKEAMEYNIFNRRIIAPLVTITDQELKMEFYKNTNSKKSISYMYEVVDYSISKSKVQSGDIKNLPKILEQYRETGNLPEIYKDIEMDNLGKFSGEDVPKNIKETLRHTNEKKFSEPLLLDSSFHVFYVVKKSIVDSKEFLQAKGAIYNRLFLTRSIKLSKNWFSRESLNFYILDNL